MRVDPTYIQQLTTALSQTAAQQQRISSEISSGVRLTGLGDDPAAVAQNVQLSAQIGVDNIFTQTATTTTSRLQVADSTLASVVDQINSAISVATAGNNGTNTAANRTSVAQELTSIRDEVLGLANTSYSGQYLFSGSQNGAAPFQLDQSTSPAVVTYLGDSRVNSITTPGGQSIGTNVPGAQIFTASSANLLGTLNALIDGFTSGNTALTTALASQLSAALSQVNTQRSSLDSAINRLQSASSYATQERTQLTVNQTNLLQTDLPTAAAALSSNETQQAALESVIVSIQKQGTLFDRL